MEITSRYSPEADVSFYRGDCRRLLKQIPPESARLLVTSPPYNLGKPYERPKKIKAYLRQQAAIIRLCVDRIMQGGSICWQAGNYVAGANEIVPLDILFYPLFAELGLKLRNRIIWHFGHGLHALRRLSGRYETILWFTKGDDYVFNLDPIRVPQTERRV